MVWGVTAFLLAALCPWHVVLALLGPKPLDGIAQCRARPQLAVVVNGIKQGQGGVVQLMLPKDAGRAQVDQIPIVDVFHISDVALHYFAERVRLAAIFLDQRNKRPKA